MRCCIQNCTTCSRKTTKIHGFTFHLFPREQKLRTAWLEALGMQGREPKHNSVVCSKHFSENDFYFTENPFFRRIRAGACPVRQDCSATNKDVQSSSDCSEANLDVPDASRDSPEEDLDEPVPSRVCKICLAVDAKMSTIGEDLLYDMYEELTGITACRSTWWPQRVCWECGARLAAAAQLRGKALRAESALKELLQRDSCLTLRDIRSVDRTRLQLVSTLAQKLYDDNGCHVIVEDHVKVEQPMETDVPRGLAEVTIVANPDFKTDEPLPLVEVKDEAMDVGHEVYFNEIDDVFDEDDDKALSEVCGTGRGRGRGSGTGKGRGRGPGRGRGRPKVEKKVKAVKDETPEGYTNRYRKSYVERRRPAAEPLDESLFDIRPLTYEEQIEEVRRRETSDAYRSAPYKCDVCFRGFMYRERYEVHAVRHDEKSGAFECFICKSRSKTSGALRKHLTAQHSEHIACKGCPFVTKNRGVARDHSRWHAGTRYQCHLCATEFTKVTTYLGHIRIKHASDFVCELCGFTFVSEKGIEVHKKRKHRTLDGTVPLEGPYCEVCNIKFLSEEAYDRHLKLSSRHSSEQDPSASDRLRNDSQSLYARGARRPRLERRPGAPPRDPGEAPDRHNAPITCEQCGEQLADLRLYAQHFRRLHPDKNRTKYPAMKTPTMCEQCGRIFQSMALLKDHMWVHTGEKRFKCDRCPKSFTQKTNLVFHARTHAAARPSYECPVCGKHFTFYNNRRRHMFIHTGLKPFKCDTCGKCFTTAGEQRAHVQHVHMKKPWPRRARARPAREPDAPWGKPPRED